MTYTTPEPMARRASARRRGAHRRRRCRARRRGHAHTSIRSAVAERQPRRDDTVRGGAGGACGQPWRRRQRRRRWRRHCGRGRGDGGGRGWRVALRQLNGDVCAHACAGGAGCAREAQGADRARRRRAHKHGGRRRGRMGRWRPVGSADADVAAVCGAAGAALAAATGVDLPQRLRRLPQASRRQLECQRSHAPGHRRARLGGAAARRLDARPRHQPLPAARGGGCGRWTARASRPRRRRRPGGSPTVPTATPMPRYTASVGRCAPR